MQIIYLMIPLSLVLLMVAIWAFFWATKSGQFDDLDSPALSILDDPVDNVVDVAETDKANEL
jgi:cbb3-type cytochrome oxidase maturation protein